MSTSLGSRDAVRLASPLSFTGGLGRIWRGLHPRAAASHGWAKAGRETLLWTCLILAGAAILAYYWLLVISVIGAIVVFGYRIGRRLRVRGELRHEELLAAMNPPPQLGQ